MNPKEQLPAPEPTLEPTPEPTPEPTLEPTPEPTPEPAPGEPQDYEALIETVNKQAQQITDLTDQVGNLVRALGGGQAPEENFFTQRYSRYHRKGGKE